MFHFNLGGHLESSECSRYLVNTLRLNLTTQSSANHHCIYGIISAPEMLQPNVFNQISYSFVSISYGYLEIPECSCVGPWCGPYPSTQAIMISTKSSSELQTNFPTPPHTSNCCNHNSSLPTPSQMRDHKDLCASGQYQALVDLFIGNWIKINAKSKETVNPTHPLPLIYFYQIPLL